MKYAQKALDQHADDLSGDMREYVVVQTIWHLIYQNERPAKESEALRLLKAWKPSTFRKCVKSLISQGRVQAVRDGYTLPELTGEILAYAETKATKAREKLATGTRGQRKLTPTERHRILVEAQTYEALPGAFEPFFQPFATHAQPAFNEPATDVQRECNDGSTRVAPLNNDDTDDDFSNDFNTPSPLARAGVEGEREGEGKGEGITPPSPPSKSKRRAPGQPMPPDWEPSYDRLPDRVRTLTDQWADDERELVATEFVTFAMRDHATYRDWDMAFANSCTRHHERRTTRRIAHGKPSGWTVPKLGATG